MAGGGAEPLRAGPARGPARTSEREAQPDRRLGCRGRPGLCGRRGAQGVWGSGSPHQHPRPPDLGCLQKEGASGAPVRVPPARPGGSCWESRGVRGNSAGPAFLGAVPGVEPTGKLPRIVSQLPSLTQPWGRSVPAPRSASPRTRGPHRPQLRQSVRRADGANLCVPVRTTVGSIGSAGLQTQDSGTRLFCAPLSQPILAHAGRRHAHRTRPLPKTCDLPSGTGG